MNKKNRKIALVTGANRGIGFEICKQLAQLGLIVLLTARDSTKGMQATKQLKEDKKLDNILFYELDVSNKNHIQRIAYEVRQQFGRLDILINNAAILYDTGQNTITVDLDIVIKALTTNLYGP